MEAHVDGFRPFLLNGVSCNADGDGVVGHHDDYGFLGITEIGEYDREVGSMLGAGEHGSVFGFGGASYNARDDGRHYVDGFVDSCWLGVIAEEENSFGHRSCM